MQLTRKEGERGQEQGDSWEVTAVIRVAVEVGRRGQPGYTVRRHGKEVNADLINAATRLYWEDAKCVCVREMGARAVLRVKASCPKV